MIAEPKQLREPAERPAGWNPIAEDDLDAAYTYADELARQLGGNHVDDPSRGWQIDALADGFRERRVARRFQLHEPPATINQTFVEFIRHQDELLTSIDVVQMIIHHVDIELWNQERSDRPERQMDYDAMIRYIHAHAEPAAETSGAPTVDDHADEANTARAFDTIAKQYWGDDLEAMSRWAYGHQHDLYRALARLDAPLVRAAVRNLAALKPIIETTDMLHVELGAMLAVAQLEDVIV